MLKSPSRSLKKERSPTDRLQSLTRSEGIFINDQSLYSTMKIHDTWMVQDAKRKVNQSKKKKKNVCKKF